MIRHDMPAAEYHAHPALNASTLKAVASKPLAKVRYDLDHRRHSPAFDIGTAAHSLILEGDASGLAIIDAPDYRGKEARLARDAAYAEGRTPLLPREHDAVRAMWDAVMSHATAHELLTGHQPEVSVFADLYGQPCKARMDAWHPDRNLIVDLKTTADANPETFARTALTYGYGQQQAHYQDLVEVETGKLPRFLFVLVEKAEPYLVSMVELDELFYDLGRQKNKEAAAKWATATRTNHWPGYEGIARVLAPVWALDELEEEITT